MGHHGSPLQLPPAPRRLCCLSSIPSRPCCCPSSSSSSSTCSSSCSSSRSLHLSSCCSSCSTCSSSSSASSSTCRSSSCCCRLHLSTCRSCSCCSSTCCCSSCSSGCSCSSSCDGSSCVCIFGVSSFLFVEVFYKQTNKPENFAPCNGFKDIINLIYSSSISLLLFCAFQVVLRIKNQNLSCNDMQL